MFRYSHSVNRRWYFSIIILAVSATVMIGQEKTRPNLYLTSDDAELIREHLGRYPVFDSSWFEMQRQIEKALHAPIDVPIPLDAGGYTHERHKKNYLEMQGAGILYSVTNDKNYAEFIRTMLLQYSRLYPTLPLHPQASGESTGRLFWQTLNETVWLVHAAQAYDAIYDFLTAAERTTIEKNLLRPMAKFFVADNAKSFNRIHNHGTWMTAAVGMAGYAMRDKNLVEQALLGSEKNKKGGFLKQLEELFSPDGYYTEGPYYFRYSIMPFYLFAQVIENIEPTRKIFEYRDGILRKALYAGLQQTSSSGTFLPFNDAIKEKDYRSPEIVLALDIAFRQFGYDSTLLSIARKQNAVILTRAGLEVARALKESKSLPPFNYRSIFMRDGADGTGGGIGILRAGPFDDQSMVFMKYGTHGLSHGHFDKLAFMYYDQGREIIQDYGAVRFINIEPKFGGRYLPENKTWALQSIAHNTVTVDEISQYSGSLTLSEQHHGIHRAFSTEQPDLQYMSAEDTTAYPGVRLQRTMAIISDSAFPYPIIVDIFRIQSNQNHQYDIPFYYLGQIIHSNVRYEAFTKERSPLGTRNGYQHLWKEASGKTAGPVSVTWMSGNRYYSLISAADSGTEVFFCRLGATDPNFDLRPDPAVIFRARGQSHVFATVIQPHGVFDGIREFSANALPSINNVRIVVNTENGTAIEIGTVDGKHWLAIASNSKSEDPEHRELMIGNEHLRWKKYFEFLSR